MNVAEPEIIGPEKSPKKRGKKSAEIAVVDKEPDVAIAHRGSQMVETLMAKAIESGNLDAMERVMAIRRELKAEAAKEAFYLSMAKFQEECPIIERKKPVWNKEHTRVIYHYAPLDYIEKIAGPFIHRNGLSYTFKSRVEHGEDGDTFVQECHVQHELGHKEISEFKLPIFGEYMNELQKRGNTNSYSRRYAFCNGFGILTEDEDQDGGSRMSPQQARETKREVRQPQMTPTAQKAANGSKRADLEPAGEGEQAIDANTVTGLQKAMEKAALGQADFLKRFPKLQGLEQVKFSDARAVMSWIADPTKN